MSYKLRSVERGRHDKEFVLATIEDLTSLSKEILTIRTKLISGQYEEPAAITTMVWRPAEEDQPFLMIDESCANIKEDPLLQCSLLELTKASLMRSFGPCS